MHLTILQFSNILILLPLVTARALSTFATPITPPGTPQAPNNKESTQKNSPRASFSPSPMGKIWCPLASNQSSPSTVKETKQAYDLLSALAKLGLWCRDPDSVSFGGQRDTAKPHTTSQLTHIAKAAGEVPLSLPPRSKASWTFGSVKAYVCNYSQGEPITCDINELEAAKEIIQLACGSKLNVNGELEPEGGPGRHSAVGGVWKNWEEEKEYGFMEESDDSEWCGSIKGATNSGMVCYRQIRTDG